MKWLSILGLLAVMACGNAMAQTVPEGPGWLTYRGRTGRDRQAHRLDRCGAGVSQRAVHADVGQSVSVHHGFDCTVLFGVNDKGQVDPTMPVYPKQGEEPKFMPHNIPGLEHLDNADLVIFFTRLLTLPIEQQKQIVCYVDSGKPIIGLRTANHGFRKPLPYKIDGKQVHFGNDVLGGSFQGHHGNWHRDSTRGDVVEDMKDHPILNGVSDIWGPSDVYRTFKEGGRLPEDCTALVYGQPLLGREQGGESNPKKEPLPIAWIKNWRTSGGQTSRVFHSTMASGKDLESAGTPTTHCECVVLVRGFGRRNICDQQR